MSIVDWRNWRNWQAWRAGTSWMTPSPPPSRRHLHQLQDICQTSTSSRIINGSGLRTYGFPFRGGCTVLYCTVCTVLYLMYVRYFEQHGALEKVRYPIRLLNLPPPHRYILQGTAVDELRLVSTSPSTHSLTVQERDRAAPPSLRGRICYVLYCTAKMGRSLKDIRESGHLPQHLPSIPSCTAC